MKFKIDEIYDEGLDFEVFETKQCFDIDSPDCSLTEDVKVQGKLDKTGFGIRCQGWLETSLSANCSRCLGDFGFTVKSRLRVHFMPKVEVDEPENEIELSELDIEQEFYEEGQIDLFTPVRDLILLSIPQIRLCDKGCAGLCPQCGTNLNEKKCDCKIDELSDPRLAVLQKLKDKFK
ncbi:MAG: DUF177 domain-containing protein [Nitrospinaceae bacterium]